MTRSSLRRDPTVAEAPSSSQPSVPCPQEATKDTEKGKERTYTVSQCSGWLLAKLAKNDIGYDMLLREVPDSFT